MILEIDNPRYVPRGNYCLCGQEEVYCPVHGWTRPVKHPHILFESGIIKEWIEQSDAEGE